MASAQQLIGLIKSHAEGDEERFFDLAMQLSAAEEQKGHTRLAEQLRQWAEAGKVPPAQAQFRPTPISAPRGPLGDLLSTSYPPTRLNNVVLPDEVASELRQVVLEMKQRDRLEQNGLKPRQRLLLAGPPGTGKTLTASALAGELRFPLFTVLLHSLISKFMGETAQKLRGIFDAVTTNRGVYLFDEIDAIASSRGNPNDIGEARRVLNSFLQFLDEDTGPSLIVATTNHPSLLDNAILRRFDLVLGYELPTVDVVEQTMRQRLITFNVDTLNWAKIAEHALGLSAADVVAAAEDAARRFVLGDEQAFTNSMVLNAIDRRRTLQRVGFASGKGSSAFYSEQSRSHKTLQSPGRRINKKTK